MRKLTILVPAHNEQDVIGDCIESLKSMKSPPDVETNLVVILDRCTDETKQIVRSMGVNFIEKRFRGKYVSAIAEVLSYAIGETDGDIVLKCDADVCEIPSDAIVKLLPHLNRNVKRVSSEVKTRSGKWWLDFIFWLRDLNNKITPLETQPRGAFTLFERKTYEEVGGFDKTKPTWDTALDLRLKCKGYKVKRVKDVF
ncbi:MAG: glycosyltransferase family 2 protein, partial [Candidatus Bathyarchaeia archaeon]